MKEIDKRDAAKMVTFIYGKKLPVMVENSQKGLERTCTVGDVVKKIKEDPKEIIKDGAVGAEMSLKEFEEVLDQIEQSETLMSMEIVDFVDEKDTDFRAFTLVDPNDEVKPLIVFRGTAGDYQWADNFSGVFSSRTPAQMRAQQYVVNSGCDHVTVAGHSKGGNLAAAVTYMLPEGMVDTAYSFDGQGVSDLFLDYISESQKENALNRVHNINEYRDVVSLLLTPTGRISNRKYIDSGVVFDETEYAHADLALNLKMSIFHAHKPNYFLLPEAKERVNRYHPNAVYDLPGWLSNTADNYSESRDAILGLSKKIAEALYTTESETEWTEEMWNAVYDAEKVYARVRKSREERILTRLAELSGTDMKKKLFTQPEGSLAVEGAVLTCQYCSGIGSLEITEARADLIQGKRVAVKSDNKKENIQMGPLECARINWFAGGTEARICNPEICQEWLLTDPDKLRGPRQEEAVLKKSILGCLRGGVIEIVHNGQLEGEDAGKVIPESKRKKSEATRAGEWKDKLKVLEQKNVEKLEAFSDFVTSSRAIGKWGNRGVEKSKAGPLFYYMQNKEELEETAKKVHEETLKNMIGRKIQGYMIEKGADVKN